VGTITKLIGDNRSATVFVSNSYFSAGKTLDDFYSEVLGGDKSIEVVQMGLQWNNWCPESSDGLLEIAKALYGDSPSPEPDPAPSKDSDNTMLYLIAGIVAVIAIAAAAMLLLKRRK
jgi:hypothetical protein